ncbi:hypothetical protein DFH08DRAFT_920849 [Mycena albidolilacea]|uniref:Uncharacterized protein n=1 Tax=Mycena albidolilacea TaxID=1033008 RepID=A0AAD7ANW5_9AGAR|nr:hypothetical protein DFH08DRAFT_920849 [Mycena albidolilacea]
MATPSSSATSPSPTTVLSPPLSAPTTDLPDVDHRKRAVEKFKARAEISNVTRSLRARLSYASYKATHNLAHVPLRDLEAQTQSQAHIFSRTMAAKRKASAAAMATGYNSTGNNNYYNNPATQGSPGGSGPRRAGTMPPPQGPMRYYPGPAGASSADATRALPAHSLFTSILAPPPSQPARTILNVADPPVPPPSRPPPSPQSSHARARTTKPSSRAGATQKGSSSRDKASAASGKAASSRSAKRAVDKGKGRAHARARHGEMDVDGDGDVDMKAAETLTHLLMNHRPSIGSASSPRSSLDAEEDDGGAYAAQFAQSSARHGGTPQPPAAGGASSSGGMPEFRRASATPPPTQQGQGAETTPRPAPTDNEAADLMLFLATSPSPVRRDRDAAAYRALHGAGALGGVKPKGLGRVLFPSAGQLSAGDLGGALGTGPLSRGGDSFTSSVSSIGGALSRGTTPIPAAPQQPQAPQIPQPPPSAPTPPPTQAVAPTAQGQEAFNFNDFLHATPPPSLPQQQPPHPHTPPQPQQQPQIQQLPQQQQQVKSLGLRADVGRKLFEEEQMRHLQQLEGGKGGREGLGAGIELGGQS